jgi:hypothetical protein
VVAYCRNLNLHELLVHFKAFAHITPFPNTYADLNPLGEFDNLAAVTKEVKMMMDLILILSPLNTATEGVEVLKFGASDVQDLNWVQLLNAYTCTECGRCIVMSCKSNR